MLFSKKDSTSASPFSIATSGKYLGNDGSWSTLTMNVGSPPQQFDVLVSTSSPFVWLIDSGMCDAAADYTVADHPDCMVSRGNGWAPGNSTSYNPLGQYALSINEILPLPDAFGTSPVAYLYHGSEYDSGAELGLDRIGFLDRENSTHPLNLDGCLVYDLSDRSFWVATLGVGLGELSLNGNSTINSVLGMLSNDSAIPGNSWGYTAGTYYRNSSANLVLGGYDASRMSKPVTEFSLVNIQGGNATYDLQVSVESITISNSKGSFTVTNETTTPFKAVIDSTLPYLYLPPSICDTFAAMIGLEHDNNTDLYTINSTARAAMMDSEIRILVADAIEGQTKSKEIVLPYAAFDLNASWPIYDNATPYFPIRRSPSDDHNALHILGRTFLQEAYIVADFDRQNFTIADAVPDTGQVNLVAIVKPASHSGLSSGAIAGTVVGVVIVVLLVTGFGLWWWRRNQHPGSEPEPEPQPLPIERTETRTSEKDQNEGWPVEAGGHGRSHSEVDAASRAELSAARHLSEADGQAVRRSHPELEDKSDATAWALNEQRVSALSARPHELQGDAPGWYIQSSNPTSSIAAGSSPESVTTMASPIARELSASPMNSSPRPPYELSTTETYHVARDEDNEEERIGDASGRYRRR